MAISEKEHWEKIYENKQEEELSWFQPYPKTSMEFLELFNLPLTAKIIDIGGGSSHFADVLLERGYTNIWVLDISELAIASAKKGWVRKLYASTGWLKTLPHLILLFSLTSGTTGPHFISLLLRRRSINIFPLQKKQLRKMATWYSVLFRKTDRKNAAGLI